MIPRISLEQWATFKAVVDEGSFARAAELLNKSQSSVSYAIARLEERLPAPVLVQSGRKAELTELGKVLYRHASALLRQAASLDETARALAGGWEAEVLLAIDGVVPRRPVFCALQRFSQAHPETRVKIMETTLSGTEEALLLRQADIVITGRVPPGFLGRPYGEIGMVAVASPAHPLFALSPPIDEQDLRQHRQIVVRDSGSQREQDAGWLNAEQRWTVSHFSTGIEAIKAGLGFAFVPRPHIEHELANDQLRPLPLATGGEFRIPLTLVLTAQSAAGPAACAVAESLLANGTGEGGR